THTRENSPARPAYASNQALRGQLTESQTRHLKPANKSAPATGNLASVYDTRRTSVTRQLTKAGIVLFRLQLSAQRGVLLYRRAFAFIAIDPGGLGHKEW